MDLDTIVLKIKDNLLSVVIVGICAMVAMNTYNTKKAELDSLARENQVETQKNEVLQEISGLEKNYQALQDKVNTKDTTTLISTLSAMAKESNVKIMNIKPSPEEDFSVYSRYPFELSVTAASYHVLGKFVSRVENSSGYFTVDSIEIGSGGEQISARLTISTIAIR